jgi:hypothetical protein
MSDEEQKQDKEAEPSKMEVHISVHTDDYGLFVMVSKSGHASNWPKEIAGFVADKTESSNMGRLMLKLIEEGRVQISLYKVVCGKQTFVHDPITPPRKK